MVPQRTEPTHAHPGGLPDRLLTEEVVDHVTALLAGLGDTAGAIAAHLAALGITGHQSESDRCPIANYLSCVEPSLYAVNVLGDVAEIRTADGTDLTVPLPDQVNLFVTRFDLNQYPRLTASEQPDPVADPGTTIRKEDHP